MAGSNSNEMDENMILVLTEDNFRTYPMDGVDKEFTEAVRKAYSTVSSEYRKEKDPSRSDSYSEILASLSACVETWYMARKDE